MSKQIYGFLSDFVFKYVFGRPQTTPLLSHLLNALLERPNDNKISVLEIINPFNLKEFSEDKFSVVDVKAKDEAGTLYTIEVQILGHSCFIERAMYYLSRLYSSQVKDGEKYTQLRKTIGISIIDFDLLAAETRIHNCYKLLNTVSKNELTDLFELNFVELTKFKLDKPRALQTKFEKWLHVIKFGDALYGDGRALPEELINEEGITMAFEELNKVNADPVMRDILEARAKAMSTIATIKEDGYIQGMTKGIIDGKVLGRTEGREEGRAEGKAEGKVEGKAEGKTEGELQGKIDSVKTLVKVKFGDIKSEEISKLQKMNIEQIEAVLTKIFSYANYDEFKNEIAIK